MNNKEFFVPFLLVILLSLVACEKREIEPDVLSIRDNEIQPKSIVLRAVSGGSRATVSRMNVDGVDCVVAVGYDSSVALSCDWSK